MNTSVIVKIEYKFKESESWTEMAFTAYSASMSEKTETAYAGRKAICTVNFRVPQANNSNSELLNQIASRRSMWQITDSNMQVHRLGNDTIRARMEFTKQIDGKPGGWNGYECVITYQY